jgi:hypothetical protein
MQSRIEVYIKSFSVSQDVESYRIHRMHSHCAPGLAEAGLELSGFSGRVLETDSADLVSLLGAARKRWGQRIPVIQVYDVGRLRGRLKAMTAGVWRTPAVVVGGEKHVGLSAARTALYDLGTNNGTRESKA